MPSSSPHHAASSSRTLSLLIVKIFFTPRELNARVTSSGKPSLSPPGWSCAQARRSASEGPRLSLLCDGLNASPAPAPGRPPLAVSRDGAHVGMKTPGRHSPPVTSC